MNWPGIWHLGTRYIRRNRTKTILLTAAFTLVWLLPTTVARVVSLAEKHLRSRAADTPLIIGRTGSPLELVFNGLYFTRPEITTFPYREATELDDDVSAIPIYARYSAQENRIVGTTIDYFRFRNIDFAEGRSFIRMGECVLGAKVAEANDITVGDSVISSPGSMFDLAGVYPLKMNVCGIMAPTGSPDDNAIFVDLKTTWIIEGLGHGHEEADKVSEDQILPGSEDGKIKLNASVVNFNEVTAENAADFHFHGDQGDFPISSAIVITDNAKSQALLKGSYLSRTDMQIISPAVEMDELFDTVFRIQQVVTGILFLIGIATLAIGFLVFILSYRLRIREFQNLSNMGADPLFLKLLIGFEAIFVLIASLVGAGLLLLMLNAVAPVLIRAFLS
ncbi:MAG: ABC transporter permease [Verrucomicrobiales bacterium]|nr:ABC transporter permease [Verrucomicrobiales bacterium]